MVKESIEIKLQDVLEMLDSRPYNGLLTETGRAYLKGLQDTGIETPFQNKISNLCRTREDLNDDLLEIIDEQTEEIAELKKTISKMRLQFWRRFS